MVVRTSRWKPQTGDVVECLGYTITDEFRDAAKNKPGFKFLDSPETRVIDAVAWNRSFEEIVITRRSEPQSDSWSDLWSNFTSEYRRRGLHLNWGLVRKCGMLNRAVNTDISEIPTLAVRTLDSGVLGKLRNPYFVPSRSVLDTSGRKVHGVCQLPPGYALCIVPPDTKVLEAGEDHDDDLGGESEPVDQEKHDESEVEQKQDGKEQVQQEDRDQGKDGQEQQNEYDAEQMQDGEKQVPQEHSEQGKGDQEQNDEAGAEQEQLQQAQCDREQRQNFIKAFRRGYNMGPQRLHHNFPLSDPAGRACELSSNHNLPKGLIAIFQVLYASATLYRARGDQIQRYGYAAFGLTVAPYLVMSIVNIISAVLIPEYPTTYLVRSDAMDEALRREAAKFEGVVGTIQKQSAPSRSGRKIVFKDTDGSHAWLELDAVSGERTSSVTLPRTVVLEDTSKPRSQTSMEGPYLMIPSYSEYSPSLKGDREFDNWVGIEYAALAIALIPVVIIGVLSSFKPGQSTNTQRVWTMTWLAIGIVYGPTTQIVDTSRFAQKLMWLIFFGTPAIGGFVVVGQMLKEYGNCVRLF